ncbi:MAG: TolC family protein [Bacteroidetes bacterium]|nr:TolC family protein [Bacteroidota bacterium]
MLNLKSYTLLLALSVIVFHAKAQDAGSNSFSLQQSIDYAYKNSPNYLNAQSDVLMAKYKRKEVLGMAMPQIGASVDMKNFLEIPTSLIPGEIFGAPAGSFLPVKFGTTFQTSAALEGSLLVFSADYLIGLKATKEMIGLMNISVARSKTDVVSQVSKAYYGVLVNKERIKLLDANLTKLEKLLSDTRAFNKQGFVEQIDVDRLEVSYNNLLTEKQKIER